MSKKLSMLEVIKKINEVEGFDPNCLAEEYALEDGKVIKKLPVRWRIAWLRLKYPKSKIKTEVVREGNTYVATAYVYTSKDDPVDCYLANGTASRVNDPNIKISALEWAQTAAIGVALRNAGFGLDYEISNSSAYEDTPEHGVSLDSLLADDEEDLEKVVAKESDKATESKPSAKASKTTKKVEEEAAEKAPEKAASPEKTTDTDEVPPIPDHVTDEEVKAALAFVYHGRTHNNETLGDILNNEPRLIKWLAEKPSKVRGSDAARVLIAYSLNK